VLIVYHHVCSQIATHSNLAGDNADNPCKVCCNLWLPAMCHTDCSCACNSAHSCPLAPAFCSCRKEKTTLFGVSLLRSPVSYRAAQVLQLYLLHLCLLLDHPHNTRCSMHSHHHTYSRHQILSRLEPHHCCALPSGWSGAESGSRRLDDHAA